MRFDVPLASCQEASKTIVFLENTENTLDLNGSISPYANAVSIILMHNHPSGDSTPSREDIEATKRLVEAGKVIGVEVLDHIIIGDRYASLKEKGYV